MPQPTLPCQLVELIDREAIRECLRRYCQDIDWQDETA